MSDLEKELYGKNVLRKELQTCNTALRTGFYKDGYCRTDKFDTGTHAVCAHMTKDFLEFSKKYGEDLTTRNETLDFPGLVKGDRWCVCASRWREALKENVAPPVFLDSTHERTLKYVSLEDLQKHAENAPSGEKL